MLRKQLQILLIALAAAGLPLTSPAQDMAQLPYSMVGGYLDLFKSLEHLNRIVPSMMITSTNPEVAAPEIEFRVKTPEGWQNFNPDENGVIVFPYEPDWVDLVLLSNQPKGTLQLVIGFSARRLERTSMSYQDLMSLVPQFDEALNALATLQGQPPSNIKGLTILLPEDSGASVNVNSKKGPQKLKSFSNGVVVIKYDEALWQENPPVEFDELPIGIIPLR